MIQLLLAYSVVLALVVAAGAAADASHGSVLPFVLFVPVVVYLVNRIRTEWRLGSRWLLGARLTTVLLYYSFVLASLMALGGLFGATTLPQLASALVFIPLVGFLTSQVLPRKKSALPLPAIITAPPRPTPVAAVSRVASPQPLSFDGDRRQFLKIAGSAGLGLFVWSIFTDKAQAAFFGSVPGPGTVAIKDSSGIKIDPAKHHPTDGYKINQVDESDPAYYGFVDKDGDWFIMKEDSSGNYRYYRKKVADGTFAASWPNRATLTPYDYYDAIF